MTMSEPEAQTPEPPAKPSFWRRWGWRIVPSVAIAVAIAGYYERRYGQVAGCVLLPDTGRGGPFKLVVYLPQLGKLEDFRENQEPACAMCRKLGLPPFPDISSLDPDGQKQFYNMFLMLRAEPKDHDKYGLLGQLFEAQKFPELAVQLYRRAIETGPDDYEWHYALALRRAKDGEHDEAEAQFKRASELNPDYAPVWMRRAWWAARRGDGPIALAFVNRYVALRGEDPFGYVQRAQTQLDLGLLDAMEESLQRAQALGPIGKQGHRLLSTLYHHRGRLEDSRFHRLMAAEAQPGDEMDDPVGIMVHRLRTARFPLISRFEGLVDSERYAEAIEIAEEVATRHKNRPDFGIICSKIAECHRHVRHYREALLYAEQARQAMPDKAVPYAQLALVLADGGKFQAALQEANKALEIDPDLDTGLYARGLTRIQLAIQERRLPTELRQADPESIVTRAIQDLERSVEKRPVNYAYLIALATAHGMLEHYGRANELLATALRIIPDDRRTLALKMKAERQQNFWPKPVADR